jgi:hypothetical protein
MMMQTITDGSLKIMGEWFLGQLQRNNKVSQPMQVFIAACMTFNAFKSKDAELSRDVDYLVKIRTRHELIDFTMLFEKAPDLKHGINVAFHHAPLLAEALWRIDEIKAASDHMVFSGIKPFQEGERFFEEYIFELNQLINLELHKEQDVPSDFTQQWMIEHFTREGICPTFSAFEKAQLAARATARNLDR